MGRVRRCFRAARVFRAEYRVLRDNACELAPKNAPAVTVEMTTAAAVARVVNDGILRKIEG